MAFGLIASATVTVETEAEGYALLFWGVLCEEE